MNELKQLRAENARLREDLAQARRDLAAGVKEGKAAIEAYRMEKARHAKTFEALKYFARNYHPVNCICTFCEAIDSTMRSQSSND